MPKRLLIVLILMLLLQSMSGLLLGRRIPHGHILIGGITAEQLHEHLAAEAQANSVHIMEITPSGRPVLIPSSGMILSIPLGGDIASIPLYIEMALVGLFVLIAPFLRSRLDATQIELRKHEPLLTDPPPRLFTPAR